VQVAPALGLEVRQAWGLAGAELEAEQDLEVLAQPKELESQELAPGLRVLEPMESLAARELVSGLQAPVPAG
jgi:hypothetical protein